MTIEFDFYSDDFQSDPGKTFARMQKECPFHKSENYGWYSVFRYADILKIVRDNKNFSARFGPGPSYADEGTAPVLVSADPPLHTAQKSAISQAFNPQLIASMEDGIRAFAGELIDNFKPAGRCDLVQDLAVPVPLWVICNMLDIPYEENKTKLRGFVEFLAGTVYPEYEEGAEERRAQETFALFEFFTPFVQSKIDKDRGGEDAGDDLLGMLVKARIDDAPISVPEILSFAMFLLVAGSATTTNTLGNFFERMLKHPEVWDEIKANPDLLDNAIEEVLRIDAPVHGLFRTNNAETVLGDLSVPKDSKICMMWGSANRDPEVFQNPHEFNIHRDPKELRRHMTFGNGVHLCMGAPLARLEVKCMVQEFMKRIPKLERNGAPVAYPYATLNGLDNLPVKF